MYKDLEQPKVCRYMGLPMYMSRILLASIKHANSVLNKHSMLMNCYHHVYVKEVVRLSMCYAYKIGLDIRLKLNTILLQHPIILPSSNVKYANKLFHKL